MMTGRIFSIYFMVVLLLFSYANCKNRRHDEKRPVFKEEEVQIPGQKTEFYLLTNDNFRPYEWLENGTPVGIDIDILTELGKRTEIDFKIDFVPWNRLLRNTEMGKCDGAFAAFWTEERAQYAIYTDVPLHISTFKVFVKKGNEFSFESIGDLFGKRIAKMRGFSISEEFDLAEREFLIEVDESDSLEDSIKKTIMGRIEGFVGNQHVVAYTLKEMGYQDLIVPLEKPLREPRSAFLIISKASRISDKERLVRLINATLQTMSDDGTIAEITSNFLK